MRPIRLLTIFTAAFAMAATASPAAASMPGNNGKIAFASNRSGHFEIWTVNPDGTGLVNLTNTASPTSNRGPAWSPDGTKLAFHSDRSGSTRIYVMNADGSNVSVLTSGPGIDANASWSPDGTQIAFESNRGGNAQIYIVDVTTRAVRQLTTGSADHVGASWSPNGDKIAYGTGVGCGDCANKTGNLEIHVINVDGTDDRTLTSEPANPSVALNTSRHPDWSPDGDALVFSSARTGALEIWMMDANGEEQTQITQDGTAAQFPYFSPDGETIVYSSAQPGTIELRIISTEGTNELTLISGSSNLFPRWQSLPQDGNSD